MIVLGADCGLAHFGIAIVRLGRRAEEVVDVHTFATKKSNAKQNVLAADDNVRRCRELAAHLLELCGAHTPVAICAESMSAPRHASAAAKLSMSWGALATVAQLLGLPVVQCSPQAIKKAVCGAKGASKEDIQAELCDRYSAPLFAHLKKGDREHAGDALAAVVAGLDSDVIRMARQMLPQERKVG